MDPRDCQAALDAARRAGLCLEPNPLLSPHTSFGIGGPAAALCKVDTLEALRAGLSSAHSLGVPVLLLGAGTNLLVSDSGWPGLALLMRLRGLAIDSETRRVRVAAGVRSHDLVRATIEASLSGLEFAAGLPGTVGGAVAGNAGCFGGSFGERLVEATIVDECGAVHRVEDPSWFEFTYRSSRLQRNGAVLVDATFALSSGDRQTLEHRAAEFVAVRREKHPLPGIKTAGSYFKNLPPLQPGGMRRAAGALLDAVGAKTMSVGDASVFERHANIIVNRGNATARDVLELADKMASAVGQAFGVELEPEVRFIGHRPTL